MLLTENFSVSCASSLRLDTHCLSLKLNVEWEKKVRFYSGPPSVAQVDKRLSVASEPVPGPQLRSNLEIETMVDKP
jgi:hypothetical protein